MRYTEFRDLVFEDLRSRDQGSTWKELRARLELPYDNPCPEWVARMELESGLVRRKGIGKALIWMIERNDTDE